MRARVRSGTLLTVLIVAIISFAAGTRSDVIFAKVGSLLGLKVDASTLDLSSVQETYRALKANYDGDIDIESLIHGASRGMVDAVGGGCAGR